MDIIDYYENPSHLFLFENLVWRKKIIDFSRIREWVVNSLSIVLEIDISHYFEDKKFQEEKITKQNYKNYLSKKIYLIKIVNNLLIDLENFIEKYPNTSFEKVLDKVLKDKYKWFSFEELSRILVL